MKAELLFHEKRILHNKATDQLAVAELRIWKIPKSKAYPKGIKYALFLVESGKVLVGMDNHKPKGPHLHLGSREVPYDYVDEKRLLEDFWDLARKAGFKP
jgi:hypothetical protein